MKAIFALATMWIAASQAYVVTVWTEPNCGGAAASRNVYDNTCAPTGGFQSYQITTYGGTNQKLFAYSRNACAGPSTGSICANGSGDSPALGACINTDGGSNALSSGPALASCP